jgi:hypothetical protein
MESRFFFIAAGASAARQVTRKLLGDLPLGWYPVASRITHQAVGAGLSPAGRYSFRIATKKPALQTGFFVA